MCLTFRLILEMWHRVERRERKTFEKTWSKSPHRRWLHHQLYLIYYSDIQRYWTVWSSSEIKARLVMNWLRANEKGFSSYKSCILTCFACFKNMNFGGSSHLFKKLGPKFEDEGLFYSFQYKFFSRIQDNEMLTQSECFQVTNDVTRNDAVVLMYTQ